MLRKVWVIVDTMDNTVLGQGHTYETRERAQTIIDSLDYFGSALEVREIEANITPLTKRGEKAKERLEQIMEGTIHFHMSLQPGWFAMSPDDRYEFMVRIFEEAAISEPGRTNLDGDLETTNLGFPKSNVEPVDVRQWVNEQDIDK